MYNTRFHTECVRLFLLTFKVIKNPKVPKSEISKKSKFGTISFKTHQLFSPIVISQKTITEKNAQCH